jgi:hypothetical protein
MDATAGDAFARPRPRVRGLDATTRLDHFALVTFAVDAGRLAGVLPAGLEPEIRRLDDGDERAFVSAVSFRDVDFRFGVAPRIRASFFQKRMPPLCSPTRAMASSSSRTAGSADMPSGTTDFDRSSGTPGAHATPSSSGSAW